MMAHATGAPPQQSSDAGQQLQHADHGYNSSFGDKNYYKQTYRKYESGYKEDTSARRWRRY